MVNGTIEKRSKRGVIKGWKAKRIECMRISMILCFSLWVNIINCLLFFLKCIYYAAFYECYRLISNVN